MVTKVQKMLNPHRSSNKSIPLPRRTENSASKPLFSVFADGLITFTYDHSATNFQCTDTSDLRHFGPKTLWHHVFSAEMSRTLRH